MSDGSDDDWFNKDEEELLQSLQIKEKSSQNGNEAKTEHIKANLSNDDVRERRLEVAAKGPLPCTSRIPTSELRKLMNDHALDAFLHIFTQETPDFLADQIAPNDSMERVLIYLRVLTTAIKLKIPAFHSDMIIHFVKSEEMLKHLRIIATKFFTKPYQNLWNTDSDIERLDTAICDIQALLIEAYTFDLLTSYVIELMTHIKKLMERNDSSKVIERKVCLELLDNIKYVLNKNEENKNENSASKPCLEVRQIYPTLNELVSDTDYFDNSTAPQKSLATYDYKSVTDYISIQRETLRADFSISLRDCVKELRVARKLNSNLAAQVVMFNNVEIMLNQEFLNAQRHEMLFAHIEIDKENKSKISQLKSGSLLCFTKSFDFDELILAVVTYQDPEMLKKGYISIEIVRQYNIGNIYDKNYFMFTSPAFFEPYRNVYNYLNTCNADDFPMQEYIVFGKASNKPPSYLTSETFFTIDNYSFQPLKEPPPIKLPLNTSQRSALQSALTNRFALIQGPPGTGKTHLTVQLVKMLIENTTPKPIIVVAYTNDSLDKFLIKLSSYTSSIARFGSQTRLREVAKYNVESLVQSEYINPRLRRLYFVVNMKHKAAFQHLQKVQAEFDSTDEGYQLVLAAQRSLRMLSEKLNTINLLFKYYAVRERAIIAMTTTCAAKMNFLLRLLGSQIIIFEEAAEILESHVVACLTPCITHVIMVGDHMQLKPYTSNYQHSRSCDLNISLFERLIQRNVITPVVLLTQYRMRPVIAELMSPIFYNELHNDDSVEHYPLVRGMQQNLYFVTHDKKENHTEKDPSVHNRYEKSVIINMARYLIEEAAYECEDIVILSPYAKQIEYIRMLLSTLSSLKGIRATTVDSFQGLEAKIVLLSLVRSNNEGRIGFLQEKNRVCVALSRAQHGLYIVGNMKLLASCSSTWCAIELKLKSHDLIGEKFPCCKEIHNENYF